MPKDDAFAHLEHDIRRYVEGEAQDETIQRVQFLREERVLGERYECWDVQTDKERYWVISPFTNLYSHKDHPNLDQTFTLHLGLQQRVLARQEPLGSDEERDRLSTAWRKWEQASEALDEADEAEEFQSVGMRCRESLLSAAREMAGATVLPEGVERPQIGNFLKWSELFAEHALPGGAVAEIRSHIKELARSTWGLVGWVTHNQNATRFHADFAIHSCAYLLAEISRLIVRQEREIPDRCPTCGSYRLLSAYRPDLNPQQPYLEVCESCGWEQPKPETG
jgi:hypothetical protein